jgi:hypothetical protein
MNEGMNSMEDLSKQFLHRKKYKVRVTHNSSGATSHTKHIVRRPMLWKKV